MHVVQCPHCRKKFKVPEPVSNARMKCSKCEQVFVGSSSELPDAPAPPVPSNVEGPASRPARPTRLPAQRRQKTSSNSVILLAVCIFAVLGIIAMAVVGYYRYTHPTLIVRDAKTGVVIEKRKTTLTEAEQRIAEHRSASAARRQGLRPANGDRTGPSQAGGGDPKLQTGWEPVRGGVVGQTLYVCGTVLNTYTVPQKQITVTAYIDGAFAAGRTYQFVPAEGTIRFSLYLGGNKADRNSIKVVASGEKADADTIIWAVETDRMVHKEKDGKVIWTGKVRNPTATPVKNVRIYCDFFSSDGIQAPGDTRIGELAAGRTIGAGKSAYFNVELDAIGAEEVYQTKVARAVAEKY